MSQAVVEPIAVRKPTDDQTAWKRICRLLRELDPCMDMEETKRLMEDHFEYFKAQDSGHSGGHPLLHEAAHQARLVGADQILCCAWESERWKPLFDDPEYRDKYDMVAWERMVIRKDSNPIRQTIKRYFKDRGRSEQSRARDASPTRKLTITTIGLIHKSSL